jgi:hypothetical protein
MNDDATNLDRLHDLVAPAPVPWWPPAPGWYWVLGAALVVLLALLVRAFIRWQHNRYRREALAELERHETVLENPDRRAANLLALAELMKRTAITAYSREKVAALTGADWFAFLDRSAQSSSFGAGLGSTWQKAIYDPPTAAAFDRAKMRELTAAIRHWIRNHQPETAPNGAPPADPAGQAPAAHQPC